MIIIGILANFVVVGGRGGGGGGDWGHTQMPFSVGGEL